MSYYCELCHYTATSASGLSHHKNTKKHQLTLAGITIKKSTIDNKYSTSVTTILPEVIPKLSSVIINDNIQHKLLVCPNCDTEFKHKSNLSRHKKNCKSKPLTNNTNENIISELKHKLELTEKEKEFEKKEKELYKKLEEQKSEFLNNFMNNANVLLNKANDNTKITAQAMQNVSISAIKYANEKFKTAPVLLPIENFNINNLSFDRKEDREQLTETLIYNAKLKSLDKLLGEHIIKYYKKDNPQNQSIHATDCSRLNYIVRELIENVEKWEVDKNGIKVCTKIIKPLIDKCIELLLEHQKELIDEMAEGNYKNRDNIHTIINIIMSIDKGSLETDINKYIAPHFNITK
jgi:uncharacterized C2H2 Zn-finger protein